MAQAVRFMEGKFTEILRIEWVAAHVCLSPDRFTEVFAQHMGRTPSDYLRFLRVERAKLLLQSSGDSMAKIAEESGFGEAAHFSRVFRAATGMTPREFRRQSTR